jgi:hypothetical protein
MLGAAKINFISKFVSTATVTVLRRKLNVRANGNAAISTSQSKFGGTSAAFDGTGDYLQISSTADALTWNASTGYTVECWFRANSFTIGGSPSNYPLIIGNMNQGGDTNYWSFGPASSTTIVFYYYNGSSQNRVTATVATMSTGTWYHIAFTYSTSGTMTIWFNGTSSATGSVSGTPQFSTTEGLFVVGQVNNVGYNGYLDELRISNTARYSAGFSVETAPFVNDANTLLLIHADGTNASTYFEDDNGVRSQRGIAANGNAQVSTAQSKFGGASALFDGSGDYLLVGLDTSMALGSGNWTIEMWVRLGTTGLGLIYDPRPYSTNGFYPTIYTDGGRLKFFTNSADRIQSNVLSTATWYHLAVVKNSGSTIMYIDGTQQGSTYTDSNTYVNSGAGENRPIIGAAGDTAGGAGFNGYLDEIRVSNIARYTATFTSSTTPFSNDSNTLLLMHMSGTNSSTDFRDDNGARTQCAISSVNGANISSSQSYFGATSASFASASSQYALLAKNTDLTDLTVEFWYRATTLPGSGLVPLISFNNTLMYIGYSGGTVYDFYNGGSRIALNTVTINTGTWYNVAFVRSGGNITVYHNGTSVATGSSWSTAVNWGSYDAEIGKYSSYYLNGFIDELRISNTARYSANYSVATIPFQNDANTLLLMHADATNGSTVFLDDNGIAPYTV